MRWCRPSIHRTVGIRLLLLLSLIGVANIAHASVWVDVSASPNPFSPGNTIGIQVNASWDQHYSQCTWPDGCWPDYVVIQIDGSDGASTTCQFNVWRNGRRVLSLIQIQVNR